MMKQDTIEVKSSDKSYIVIQRSDEGTLKRVIGKMKESKGDGLLSLTKLR